MTNFYAKATNSIAKWMNSIAKVTNSFANGTNSIAKATNSIAKTCNCFDINKTLLKSTKPVHHWTPQLIRSKKSLFSAYRVNDTQFTGAYSQYGKIKCFVLISLMDKSFFQVTPIDIGTQILLDQSCR